RVSGIKQLLHLLLLIGPGIDVTVRVDEARHRCHAARIDGLHARNGCAACRYRSEFPAANNNRPLIDHAAVTDDDSRIRDHKILCREIPDATQAPKESQRSKGNRSLHLLHFLPGSRRSRELIAAGTSVKCHVSRVECQVYLSNDQTTNPTITPDGFGAYLVSRL